MKNTYIAIGAVVIVVILAFVFGRGKVSAPKEELVNTTGTTTVALADGAYTIDPATSVIKWKGEFVTGKGEEGTVNLKSGSISVAGGIISGGSFAIDMTTIKDMASKELLETHLKSDEFFGVEKYPESTFVLRSFTPSSADGAKVGRYIVGGNLTVRGIEKPISFPATITMQADGSIKAESSFAINRAEWQIKYNSQTFFQGLGDKVIRDAVEIALDLRAIKE